MKRVNRTLGMLLGFVLLIAPLSLRAQEADEHEGHDHEQSEEDRRVNGHKHDGHDHATEIKKRKPRAKAGGSESGASKESAKSQPRIVVDDSNFKSIFDQSVETSAEQVSEETRSFEMEVVGRYVGLRDLNLTNPYFNVDYAEAMQSMPTVQIGGAKEVWKNGGFTLSPTLAAGYGFTEEKLSVTTRRGTPLVDVVSLHIIPLTLGAELKQRLGFMSGTSAFITPQLGTQWLRQSGTLDGMEQTHWISFYGVRAGLVLFQPEVTRAGSGGSWFDGVTVSSTLQNSLGAEQQLSTWSWDLGLRMLL